MNSQMPPDEADMFTRVEAYRATLTPKDQSRLSSFTGDLRVAIGRVYGQRLGDLAVNTLVDRFIVDDTTITSTKTDFSQLPEAGSRTGWDALAKQLVEGDYWCCQNLISSDRALKAKLAEEFKTTLAPARIMTLVRTGQWEKELDQYVKANIARRLENMQ